MPSRFSPDSLIDQDQVEKNVDRAIKRQRQRLTDIRELGPKRPENDGTPRFDLRKKKKVDLMMPELVTTKVEEAAGSEVVQEIQDTIEELDRRGYDQRTIKKVIRDTYRSFDAVEEVLTTSMGSSHTASGTNFNNLLPVNYKIGDLVQLVGWDGWAQAPLGEVVGVMPSFRKLWVKWPSRTSQIDEVFVVKIESPEEKTGQLYYEHYDANETTIEYWRNNDVYEALRREAATKIARSLITTSDLLLGDVFLERGTKLYALGQGIYKLADNGILKVSAQDLPILHENVTEVPDVDDIPEHDTETALIQAFGPEYEEMIIDSRAAAGSLGLKKLSVQQYLDNFYEPMQQTTVIMTPA